MPTLLAMYLHKKRNVDFLLGESDIPDDDAPNFFEGMDEETTEPPREPKKNLEDVTSPGEGVFEQESDGGFQIAPNFASPSAKDNTVTCSSSIPLASPGIYIPKWESLKNPFLRNILLRMIGTIIHSLLLTLKPWSSSPTLTCPIVFST